MAGTITLALRTAQSGLLVNQQALDAIANNIANVNSPGYSRKVVNVEQRVVGGVGAGVQLSEITRVVDEGLVKSYRLEAATTNELKAQNSYFDRLQDLFGDPASNTSVGHVLADFLAAIESVAVSPDKTLEHSEMVRRGQEVARKLQSMSASIQDLRKQADTEIEEAVDRINELTHQIADLNDKIIRNKTVTADVSDLRDQRDQALDELSGLVDVRYFYRGDGDVVVFTSAGRTLVDNVAFDLSHNAVSSVTPTVTHSEGDIDGIYVGTRIAGNDITGELRGGKLKGLVDLRDQVLTDLQSQLDELSTTVRDTVNQIHNRGTAFPGLQSMSGTRRFVDTSNAANTANQTITLDPTGGVDDVTIALFNGSGDQQAATTVRTIMGGGGPFTVTQLATNLETWLQANGAATASVGLDSSGRLNIDLNETSLNLAFRDQTATANGSSQADAEIGFDADGDGTIDETVSGFSNFFGLNDFFTDGLVRNIHESNVITSSFTSSGTTLRFVDGTASLPLDPGGGGDVTLAIPAGSTLEEIAALINTNVTNVSASVIADGSGYRLRISHDTGIDMAVTETGGGSLLSNLGMHLSDTRSASQIEVRSDIIESPSLITRGVMQWNGDLGTAGEYFTSTGDDSAIQALAAQFDASNTFDSAGGLATLNVSFTQYAAAILSRNASLADNNANQSETQSALSNSLKTKSDNIRGVNLDEEMADLIRFEQAYSAAARVINVIQSMFDALNQAVG